MVDHLHGYFSIKRVFTRYEVFFLAYKTAFLAVENEIDSSDTNNGTNYNINLKI